MWFFTYIWWWTRWCCFTYILSWSCWCDFVNILAELVGVVSRIFILLWSCWGYFVSIFSWICWCYFVTILWFWVWKNNLALFFQIDFLWFQWYIDSWLKISSCMVTMWMLDLFLVFFCFMSIVFIVWYTYTHTHILHTCKIMPFNKNIYIIWKNKANKLDFVLVHFYIFFTLVFCFVFFIFVLCQCCLIFFLVFFVIFLVIVCCHFVKHL